jgi:hypothetical protein
MSFDVRLLADCSTHSSRNSLIRRKKVPSSLEEKKNGQEERSQRPMKTDLRSVSMLLCPAPSTQYGFALQHNGVARKRSSPFQKGTTSSLVPWIMYTGQATDEILGSMRHRAREVEEGYQNTHRSIFGKRSPGRVKRKLKATR